MKGAKIWHYPKISYGAAQLLPISWKATIAGSGIDEESK